MERRILTSTLLAFLLTASATRAAAVPADTTVAKTHAARGAIVFTHSRYDQDSNVQSTTLFRVNPANGAVTELTPSMVGVLYNDPRWSANGRRIVYERFNAAMRDRSQLFTLDLDSGQIHRITPALGLDKLPVWGPHGQIAFINATNNCLAVVRFNGQHLRTLFCPTFISGGTAPFWSEPNWSSDGRTVTIEARQYYEVGLSLFLQSQVYRVKVATGQVTEHLVYDLGDLLSLERMIPMQLSPDGKKGLYSQWVGGGGRILLVDFATGEQKYLGPGGAGRGAAYTAKWSHDGRRIAFTQITVEADPSHPRQGYIAYIGLYVMHADGSHVRTVTRERVETPPYPYAISLTVAGWSEDDCKILLNRADSSRERYHEEYLGHPRLEIVDVATGSTRILDKTRGSAGDEAWFQHWSR